MQALFPLEAKESKDDYHELGKSSLSNGTQESQAQFHKDRGEKKKTTTTKYPVFLLVSSYPVNTNHSLSSLPCEDWMFLFTV